MSFNREGVVWQSQDGTWGYGLFREAWVGSEADGCDPEWDVEYDMAAFGWATVGHPTLEAAWKAWTGANPGGYSSQSYSADTASLAAMYDAMGRAALLAQVDRSWGR